MLDILVLVRIPLHLRPGSFFPVLYLLNQWILRMWEWRKGLLDFVEYFVNSK